ncbi:MAG TPA: septal ring lytic transglycosylase RlpA family protein [Candidatus Tectomicrobia bacterium]|nr:septal ring lytic transglycosylase RlpA family protein [Candidatus Tectomicrobia bacterium]
MSVVALLAPLVALAALSPPPESLRARESVRPRPASAVARDAAAEIGLASWYGEWHHGRLTASGVPYDMYALTAAHRTLPLGTRVRVVDLDTGRAVDVTITDRGPYVDGRIIDLSYGAARRLDAVERGVVPVAVLVARPRADD